MNQSTISKENLVNKLKDAVFKEELATFIGAGMSMPAGFSSWTELLREPATEIGLDIEKESHDLVSLAQYYCNVNNRASLNSILINEFKQSTQPTRNHRLLAQLPIRTIWTTNYDGLIEKSLEENRKDVDVKLKDDDLVYNNYNSECVLYKMHGDIQDPSNVVLTRSDYENYGFDDRKLFRQVLEGDLLTKTFLFLGFSFEDPNFKYILGKLRILLGEEHTRQHYCIMKDARYGYEEDSYKVKKQQLQIDDLKRYGIKTCLIEDYDEIEEILESLVNIYRRKTVFISGSASSYAGFDKYEAQRMISDISYNLVKNGYHIVNGYGLGVGNYVIDGVSQYCYENKNVEINDLLTLMPFPLDMTNTEQKNIQSFYRVYREQMINRCGIAIYLFGENEKGEVASGVLEEYEIASSLGLVSIAVEKTGGASKEICEKLKTNCPVSESEHIVIEGDDISVDEITEEIIQNVEKLNNVKI